MFANYLTIAVRNLFKNKLYSFINILGLTIGMSCFILISLYIQYELSYDKQHEKYDQIYRVAQLQTQNVFKGKNRYALTPAPLGAALLEDYPEVETATTFSTYESLLSKDEKYAYVEGIFTDTAFFDIFTIPVIEGIGAAALSDPGNIILTQSLAQQYFGEVSPINKVIYLQNDLPLTVKGVIEDIPQNQHFAYQYLTSLKNLPFYDEDDVWYSNTSWYSHNYYTYVSLNSSADYQQLEQKLPSLSHRYQKKYFYNEELPQWFLQPLGDIHLRSQINEEIAVNGDIRYIYLFGAIAFIILILASINYMNLAVAKSADRSREIGVRKVLGAQRNQLIMQFLSESFLQAIICLFLALTLVNALLPSINDLLQQQIPFNFYQNAALISSTLLIALLIGGLSGLYPAMYLSSIIPIRAIYGGILKSYNRGKLTRNIMVIGQFVVAIVLVIGSIVVYQQINFIQQKKLGYERDQVLYIPYRRAEVHAKAPLIQSELQRIQGIEGVSIANYLPLNQDSETTVEKWEGNTSGASLSIYRNYIDQDFIPLFGMELSAGRNFNPSFATDSTSGYILNEAAVVALGWDDPIGKQFHRGKVVGVVKDYHFQPFQLAIQPMFMAFRSARNHNKGNIILKLNTSDLPNTIEQVRASLFNILPEVPFDYRFMDESYNNQYAAEIQISRAFSLFTLLALFIAGMGVFGLVSFQIVKRTKEIGIRKILGASITNIIMLISSSFVKLAMIATVIGFPIAWWGARKWLQSFAYHIEINWSIFFFAAAIAIGLAIVTAGIQSIKIAIANPTKALSNNR